MASETDFLNAALGKAGCSRISGLDENSVNADHCRIYYPMRRRALLEMANWKFADTQLQLNLSPNAPLFGLAYSYVLPINIIKLRTYNGFQINLNMAVNYEEWIYFAGGNWRIQ